MSQALGVAPTNRALSEVALTDRRIFLTSTSGDCVFEYVSTEPAAIGYPLITTNSYLLKTPGGDGARSQKDIVERIQELNPKQCLEKFS
jgi:hypothetical protein